MSESLLPDAQERAPVSPDMAQLSAGGMLRRAREAQGLHIGALAVALKVPVKKLEALEADKFDSLPDAVFVRALSASICRTLKIEAGPILARLPAAIGAPLKSDESGINAPFRVTGQGSNLALLEQLSKPVVLAVLALLAGVMVLALFPFTPLTEITGAFKSSVTPASLTPSVSASLTLATEDTVPAGRAAPPVSGAGLALSSFDAPLALSSSAVLAAGQMPVAPSSATTVTGGLLVLSARGPSWVEVVDGAGVVQVRRTLVAAEVLGVSGVPPLSVVRGRSDAVAVQVRGKLLDLTPVTKDNVSRFEVK